MRKQVQPLGAVLAAALLAAPGAAQGVTWTQAELERTSAEIQAEIEDLRDEQFKGPVPVKLSSKDEFLAYAKKKSEEEQPEAVRKADEMVLKMLGLIAADADLQRDMLDLLREQVGGFYDPAAKTFFLMDNCPAGVARIVLAHELGHALDDQLYDLDTGMKSRMSRTDAQLAYQALVEGSGTAVMTRWTLEHMDSIDLAGLAQMQEEQGASMAKAPMVLWKPLLAAYMTGAAFLARTDNVMTGQMRPADNDDVQAAFAHPPLSTEQVLHPQKYWDPAQRDDPVAVAIDAAHLPEGWTLQREDTLGETVLAILATPPGQRGGLDFSDASAQLALAYTQDAVAGWGGDALALTSKGDARALLLVTRWDTPRDAAEFYGALSVQLPALDTSLATLGGGKAHTRLAYGTGDREVLLELGCGAKDKELKKVFGALVAR